MTTTRTGRVLQSSVPTGTALVKEAARIRRRVQAAQMANLRRPDDAWIKRHKNLEREYLRAHPQRKNDQFCGLVEIDKARVAEPRGKYKVVGDDGHVFYSHWYKRPPDAYGAAVAHSRKAMKEQEWLISQQPSEVEPLPPW